jgi:hypothetical protein
MFGTTEEFSLKLGFWRRIGKRHDCQNLHHINPPLVENGTLNDLSRRQDFRVPIGQGQEAFQAAQLRGIKSGSSTFRRIIGSLSLKTRKFGKKNFLNG